MSLRAHLLRADDRRQFISRSSSRSEEESSLLGSNTEELHLSTSGSGSSSGSEEEPNQSSDDNTITYNNLSSSFSSSKPSHFYIELIFNQLGSEMWMVRAPRILEKISDKYPPGIYHERPYLLFSKLTYIHDCGHKSRDHIEEALKKFNELYNNYNYCFPKLLFENKNNNEILVNLKQAINNASPEPSMRQPLIDRDKNIENFEGFCP